MTSFSKSTLRNISVQAVLGLSFGLFLAGYAVFAFNPPAQTPPAGNVATPLNTGSSDQTKTGGLLNIFGLWVNQSLGVSGGASFGGILDLQGNKVTNVGVPTSAGDVATKGFVDSQTSSLQKRVIGSCPGGQGVRAIAADGSVTCENVYVPPLVKTCSNLEGCPGTSYGQVNAAALDNACASYCGTRKSARVCTRETAPSSTIIACNSYGYSNCSGGSLFANNEIICQIGMIGDSTQSTTCVCY